MSGRGTYWIRLPCSGEAQRYDGGASSLKGVRQRWSTCGRFLRGWVGRLVGENVQPGVGAPRGRARCLWVVRVAGVAFSLLSSSFRS